MTQRQELFSIGVFREPLLHNRHLYQNPQHTHSAGFGAFARRDTRVL